MNIKHTLIWGRRQYETLDTDVTSTFTNTVAFILLTEKQVLNLRALKSQRKSNLIWNMVIGKAQMNRVKKKLYIISEESFSLWSLGNPMLDINSENTN